MFNMFVVLLFIVVNNIPMSNGFFLKWFQQFLNPLILVLYFRFVVTMATSESPQVNEGCCGDVKGSLFVCLYVL